ncbi:MAG: ATP-dependent protease subunit HslV [Alicyclobacillaceae bacterium]|nr:ATP-dependent protease subunit HslV [Alicyclobacillaceae bacterium]
MNQLHGTTIFAILDRGHAVMAGDGQVTMGNATVLKHGAKKVRRLYHGRVLAGFAGSVADALALFERFEGSLESHGGNLPRAAVDVAKEWRTDRVLRRLEAMLVVCDREHLLLLSGSGEVLEPDDGILAVGSGGQYALAAGRALKRHAPHLSPRDIAIEAMRIASEICVYTNDRFIVEELK